MKRERGVGPVLIIALAWALCNQLLGRQASDPRSWTQITSRDGLSSDSVTCMAKDPRGFLWVGTGDGLNLYNGYSFHIYKHHTFDPQSLSDNLVYALLADRQGNLWIGTANGLDQFDRRFDRFQHFGPKLGQLVGRRLGSVYALAQDRQGDVLVAAANGCFRLRQPQLQPEMLVSRQELPSASAVACDDRGRIWLGATGGVYYLQAGRLVPLAALRGQKPRLDSIVSTAPDLPDLIVTGFLFADGGNRIYVTSNRGLYLLAESAPGRWQVWSYPHDPRRPDSPTSDFSWEILRDSQGSVWLGTNEDIERVHLPGADPGKLRCELEFAGRGPRLNRSVTAIFEERPGVLWFGSFGAGLVRMAESDWHFERYRAKENRTQGLTGTSVLALAEDAAGVVWLATDRGLERFDRFSRTFRLYAGTLSPGDPLPARNIRFIHPESDGSLWLCTMYTLKRFWPGSGRVRNYFDTSGNTPQTIYGRYMLRRRNGQLLLAGTRGLWEYDAAADRFRPPVDPALQPLTGLSLYTMYEDRQGRLLLGSYGNGLFVYTLGEGGGSLSHFTNHVGDPSSISDDTVISIHQESERILWIGTRDGLNRLEWPTGLCRRYFEEDGLPNAVIYSILPDADGGLWMSTNKGLSRLNLRQGSFRNFFLEDGLQNNEFNGNAYLRGRDGTLYFGGINGFNVVSPLPQSHGGQAFPLVITDFRVFGKPLASGPNLLDPGPPGSREIVLSYRQNFFSIEYALLDFEEADTKEYVYRMEGMDPDWVKAGPYNLASYTNLAPGRYIFRVRGVGLSARWSSEATLAIRITPPFWKTVWFTLLLVLLCVGAVAWVLLYQRLLYRKRLVERNLKLKSDLAAMIVHDLRNPLTTIQGFAKLLRKKHDEERLEESLGIIETNTARMLNLINDLLDISKFEAGKMRIHPAPCRLEHLIAEAAGMARLQLQEKDLRLEMEIDPAPPLSVDGEKISQVFSNLLGNAIKFSPGGGIITVRLRWKAFGLKPGQLVQVVDRGPGVASERLRDLFNKYAQLHQPASGPVPKGTGLGLAVSKLIVEAHGGEIGYERQQGASIFFFFLPDIPKSNQEELRSGES